MHIALSLAAFCLMGGEPATSLTTATAAVASTRGSIPAGTPQISYEVWTVEVPADAWRERIYQSCERVGRQGISTVWTTDENAAKSLKGLAAESKPGRSVHAPKVTAFEGQSASVTYKQSRYFVSDLERVESRKGGSKGVTFRPVVDHADDGIEFNVRGNRVEGVLKLALELESCWVSGLHSAVVTEKVEGPDVGKSTVRALMQLPQLVETKIKGSYDVPDGKILMVGLGAVMTTDDKGHALVMERLAIVQPRRILSESEERAAVARIQNVARPATVPSTPVALAIPRVPSRALPTPITADGKIVPLPPLPDEAVAPASHSVPAPLPSLQTATPLPRVSTPSESVQLSQTLRKDPNIQPARFEPVPVAASNLAAPMPNPVPDADAPDGTIRIPLFGIEIEFRVK